MNRITLLGRLAADPELRYTPTGVAVTRFTLAVQRSYKDKDGNYPADFIPCVVWRGLAEFIAERLAKGNRVAVDGRLETRSYKDQDGNRRKIYEVVVERVSPVDWKDTKQRLKEDLLNDNVDPFNGAGEPIEISDEDIPF